MGLPPMRSAAPYALAAGGRQMMSMMQQGYGKGPAQPLGGLGGKGGCAGCGGKGGCGGSGRPAEAFLGQRLDGLVSSWREQWGWVSSPLFSGDVFAHAEDLTGPKIPTLGAHVLFTIGKDAKGCVRALEIEVGRLLPGANSGANAPAALNAGKRSAGGMITPAAGCRGGMGKGFEAVEGQQVQGSVVTWRSPWGWVSCEGVGGDLFAHT